MNKQSVMPRYSTCSWPSSKNALASPVVRDCLYACDNMAWSYAARRQGRNPNDWREARQCAERIESQTSTQKIDQSRP